MPAGYYRHPAEGIAAAVALWLIAQAAPTAISHLDVTRSGVRTVVEIAAGLRAG